MPPHGVPLGFWSPSTRGFLQIATVQPCLFGAFCCSWGCKQPSQQILAPPAPVTPQEAPALEKGSQLPEIHKNFNPLQFPGISPSPSCCGSAWGSWTSPCGDHTINTAQLIYACCSCWDPEAASSRQQPHFQALPPHFPRALNSSTAPRKHKAGHCQKDQIPLPTPQTPAAPRGSVCTPHPRDNLFVLQLPSTQLQRMYMEIKMQSHKDASLRG